MIKMLFLVILIVVNLQAHQRNRVQLYLSEFNNLKFYQIENLRLIYEIGKPDDLSLTLVSIAMRESQLGKYLFNSTTGDYGLLHVNLKWFMKEHKIKKSYYKNIEIASLLLSNKVYNVHAGLDNLKRWLKYDKWYVAIGKYNAGGYGNKIYANKINDTVKALKIYLRKHPEVIYE